MLEQFLLLLTQPVWWSYLLRLAVLFGLAALLHHYAGRIADRLVRLSRFSRNGKRARPERLHTVRGMIANAISVLAFGAIAIVVLAEFVSAANIIWIIGLFSAAFGLGARPVISDYLTGFSFIVDDTFAVGDKVELLGIEGVVEAVNLRTTYLRAPTGELYVVPNGEVRVIRNFSRGRFSTLEVTLRLRSADLSHALPLLQDLGREAVTMLPNLLEPWMVLSDTGVIGQDCDLKLLAKARWAKAAEMRPRLLALVHERLGEAGIEMAG